MKNTLKRLSALVLALLMAFTACACGNGDSAAKTDESKEDTPAYIYNTEFKTLLSDSERTLNPRLFTDDGFYAVSYEKVGERELEEGEVLEYEGQLDIYGSKLFFVDFDGNYEELTEYKSVNSDIILSDPELIPEGYDPATAREKYTGSDLYGVAMGNDGNLIAIESAYISFNSAPEDVIKDTDEYYNYYNYKNYYFIRTLSPDGAELSSARIQLGDEEYIYAGSNIVDENNNVILGGDGRVYAISTDGSIVGRISDDTGETWIDSVSRLKDGRIVGTTYGANGMELRVIDTATMSYGDSLPIPNEAYSITESKGGDYDAYYTSGSNFYGLKFSDDGKEYTSDKLFNWINCDINGDSVSNLLVREDGSVVTVLNYYDHTSDKSEVSLATVKLVPYDSVPHKEEITLATQYLNWDIRNKIVDFNRKNDSYRIVVKDYSEYNTEEDYSAGQTKLTTELLAGNVPDIIDLNGMPYSQLASKGLLADLYELIDADAELDRADFFPNVLQAMEVNGGLYSTLCGFGVSTVMGASSVVGDEPGWTYDEFDAALALMRESVPECDPFDIYTTRYDILHNCLMLDMNDYVNWSTGAVSFDTPAFVGLLNFAAQFPESFDYENYEYTSEDSTDTRIAQGRQMLLQTHIYAMDSLPYYDNYFGGDSTYIGYPTSDGSNGSLLSLNPGYAISAKSEYKDVAWEFLRMFFTEDYQSDERNVYEIPTNLNAYNSRLKTAMTPEYYKDADGNFLLDENGEKIPMAKMSFGTENGTVDIYALTQEQADKLTDLINSCTAVADYNNDSIFDIVDEQSQAFFAGQKTAEDVTKLVQSKANIYVNEQR